VRAAVDAAEGGDGEVALRLFDSALDADPAYPPALAGWAGRALAEGVAPGEVVGRLLDAPPPPAPDPAPFVALGDALRLDGRERAAANAYEGAVRLLPSFAASSVAAVRVRQRLTPEALRALLAAGSPEARAVGLERVIPRSPEAAFFAALLHLEAGDPARALALLERLPPDLLSIHTETGRTLLGFRAEAADRARAYARVRRYAGEAAAAFRAAGAESRARRMDDLAAKSAWLLARDGATRGTLSP
jgi:tetratricopeptide (TPR) repeat protein